MDYGMFSSNGNIKVAGIVEYAIVHQLPWKVVYQNLIDLAKFDPKQYGEATDTMVRELVYDAIGAGERGEEFYV